jgi:hypothetical protein
MVKLYEIKSLEAIMGTIKRIGTQLNFAKSQIKNLKWCVIQT